jgi:hypothetical protein
VVAGSGHTPRVRSESRRVAARVVAATAAVFWGIVWFGLIDLLVVVVQDEEFHKDYLFESGWGLLFLVLVTVPLVWLVWRPGDPIALAQLGLITLAVLAGAVWRGTGPQGWNGLGLAVTVGMVAWLGRGRAVRWARPDPSLSALAIIALPAAMAYGAPIIANTTVVEDNTNGVSHYPMQASLALAVVALVALAAVTRGHLPAWTAAFSACWLGVESVLYPHLDASLGTIGGSLAVGWAVVVVFAFDLARRRTRHAGPEPPSSS